MSNRFSVEAVFKGVDNVSAPITRIENRMRRFTRRLGSSIAKVNETADKIVGKLGQSVVNLGKISSAVAGITITSTAVAVQSLTEADVKTQKLAKSVGMNVDNLEALGSAVSSIGFDVETVADQIEEMNNKLGESKGMKEQVTPVKEALKTLGLNFKEIIDLPMEKQFFKILNAAKKIPDAQKAAAGLDIFFGGEGNKIIVVL